MNRILLFLYFLLLPTFVIAEEFKLRSFDPNANFGSQFIQLQTTLHDGKSFSEIFNSLGLNEDGILIRILGELSAKTDGELKLYYKQKIPNEFAKALNSSGNLHNPTLTPLINMFPEAFKTTSLYRDIENVLNKHGYIIYKIEFEKFNTYGKTIDVPDLYLRCEKSLTSH